MQAQQPMIPATELSDYVRLLELQGKATGTPLVYRASSTVPRLHGLTVDSMHVWSRRYPLSPAVEKVHGFTTRILDGTAELTYNSGVPRTLNDGAAWAGTGVSGIVRGGAEVVWGPLTGRLYPSFAYAENRPSKLGRGPGSARGKFAYPWQTGIDFPQRFGDGAYSAFEWGQSELRLDLRAFTAGFSTENIWWGPGYRNSIIMGSAAPGFPHIDLGTGRPVHTAVGDFEVRGLWGQLKASEFSGEFTAQGRRFITGITAGYRPAILPGLTLGAERVYYRDWASGGLSIEGDLLAVFGQLTSWGRRLPDGSIGNDKFDQLASIFARWVLPESGFETYFEFAMNDYAGDLRSFILDPGRESALAIGFQKALVYSKGSVWRLKGEITNLSPSNYDAKQGSGTFYTHGRNQEGYTNRGQLLGAAIGPSSVGLYLGVDRYSRRGREGVHVEWIRTDDHYGIAGNSRTSYTPQLVDLSIAASMQRFSKTLDWRTELELTHGYNRTFNVHSDDFGMRLSFTLGGRGRCLQNCLPTARSVPK